MNVDTNKTKMIIEFGGKQHLAVPGSRIIVNQGSAQEGDSVIAQDLLTNQNVTLKVVKIFLGDKIRGIKFKSKSRYTRRYGHRQRLMILEVGGSKESKPERVKKTATTKKTVAKKAKIGAK